MMASTCLPSKALSYTSDLFPNDVLDDGWTVTSLKGNKWSANGNFSNKCTPAQLAKAENATGAAFYQFHGSQDADAWMISPALQLKAGVAYTIGIYSRTNGSNSSYPENFKVCVADANDVASLKSQNEALIDKANYVHGGDFEHFTAEFTPSIDGDYYFGINCYSKADMDNLFVTHFTVNGEDGGEDEPVVAELPLALNSADTYKVWSNTLADGQTKGNWEWYSYGPCARIFVYGTTVYDDYLTSPAVELKAGKAYSITFKTSTAENLADGTEESPFGEVHVLFGKSDASLTDYTTIKECKDLPYITNMDLVEPQTVYFEVEEDGLYKVSFHALTKIHVAEVLVNEAGNLETPAAVADFTVEPQGTTDVVNISFTVPSTTVIGSAYEAGQILTVKVFRGETEIYNNAHAIGETVSLVDNNVPDGYNTYSVVVYNGEDASETVEETVWVGELKTILADSFAGAKFNADWTVETTKSDAKWTPTASASRISAYPQDNDGGLLYFDTNSASSSNYTRLVSPELNTSSSYAPVVSFYFFHYSTSHAGNKVVVEVRKDGGDWVEVEDGTISMEVQGAEGWGWNKYSFTIRDLIAGSNSYQVSFKGLSSYYDNLAIDNILIENDQQAYFKVSNVTVTPQDNGFIVDWNDPSTDEPLTYDIVRYVDGEVSATFEGVTEKPYLDEYEPATIQMIKYSVTAHTPSASTAAAESKEIKGGSLALPFADSFADRKFNQEWENVAEGSNYKWEAASTGSRPTADPVDNDGGLIYFNVYNATANSTATLTTPPLSTKSSNNPFVSYYIYGSGSSSASFCVLVSTDGGEWQEIDGSNVKISAVPSGWNLKEFSLLPYIKGSVTYQVAFKATSDYGSYNIMLDNISIENKAENDLAVSEISGPSSVVAGNDAVYSFTVSNKGAYDVAAADYAVNVECEGISFEALELQDIAAGESAEYTFTVPFTAHEASEEAYVFNVEVVFEADEDDSNNSASFETLVTLSDKKVVENLAATLSDDKATITLTWDPVVDMNGYTPVDIHESFENIKPETTGNINGFTVLDLSEETTTGSWYGVYDTPFMVTDKPDNSYAPNPTNGDQYLVCIGGKNMNDWLISPELNCFAAATMTFSFDAYFYSDNGNSFEVVYSTTDAEPESFTKENVIDTKKLSSSECGKWITFAFNDIPAEAKYIALHVTSVAQYSTTGLFVDNVKITDVIEPVLGYHVYEEGVGRLNDEMIDPTVTSFDVDVESADAPELGEPTLQAKQVVKYTRTFTVTAVYGEGESAKSEAVDVELEKDIDGIADAVATEMTVYTDGKNLVVLNAAAGTAVYSVDGRLVALCQEGDNRFELPAGVYIVKGSTTVKVAL